MRICFVLNVKPDRLEEYKARHANVWPELQNALRESGWKSYSLFLRGDGTLVGYLEADDFDRCCAEMKRYPVNALWQKEMVPFFADLGEGAPDDNMQPLTEIFHLD